MKDFVSFTPENIEIMRKTRDLLSKYNNTKFDDNAERAETLQDMLGSCGSDVTIQTPFKVVYGKHLYIGEHVFINYGADLLDGGDIHIGNRVMIGARSVIAAGSVVTKDVPEGCLYGGNPAGLIKKIDEEK